MSSFLESFFDDGKSNFKLWSKNFDTLDYENEIRVFAGPMHKLSRKTGNWKERFFVLTNKHLIYYKVITLFSTFFILKEIFFLLVLSFFLGGG